MSRQCIVVADDEQAFAATLTFVLRSAGYEVAVAENGAAALEVIQRRADAGATVDLLLTDVQMPEMTGLELIDALERRHIKPTVIAMSAYGDKETAIELLRRGCSDYLDKPLAPDEILSRVESALRKQTESKDNLGADHE